MAVLRIVRVAVAVWLMSVAQAGAQVPADLRAAMEGRDRAFYAADAAQWERYTAPAFTTVQQDGSFFTRAERLANLKTQKPRPYVPRSRELNVQRGDVVVARFFSGGLWVIEVWTRESGSWMVLSSQVTTAKPPDAVAQAAPTAAQIRAAAFDVMRTARYCTLVTIEADGQPQARIVDPLIAEGEGTIWIATNPITRKVEEIKRDPRVTLMFFNAAANEYVTVFAKAAIVTDTVKKTAHWKAEWQPFYKQQTTGADFMLFEVAPFRLEVSSPRHGLNNDPTTWRPVTLSLP